MSKPRTFRAKVYSFFNRIVTITENKAKGIINYDSDNLLPQRIARQVSVVASNHKQLCSGITNGCEG